MKNIIVVIFRLIIVGVMFYFLSYNCVYKVGNDDLSVDTVFNKVLIDSVQLNIIEKDSIVYELKIKAKDEIKNAANLGNDSSVLLFRKLLQELD